MARILQTVEGAKAVRVLSHPDYEVVPYAARYLALADRLGLDFSNIMVLLDHLPLAISGASHDAQRADVARLMAERRVAAMAALPQIMDLHFAALGRAGSVDLMADCVQPAVDSLLQTLADVAFATNEASLVSRVFSRTMGVAQRRTLEAEAARLRALIRKTHPNEPDLRHGSRLALLVLGRDALSGTLGRSLHHHLVSLSGQPQSGQFRSGDISPDQTLPGQTRANSPLHGQQLYGQPLPVVPTHTGVPYVDRISRQGTAPDIRCRLGSLEGGTADERLRFFGSGAHVCLGRALTLDLFAAVSAQLATFRTRVTVTDYHLRKDDVFAMPQVLQVTVTLDP